MSRFVDDLNDVLSAFSFLEAMAARGSIYDNDCMICGLMDIYGIPTTSLNSLHNTVTKVQSIIQSNSKYFNTQIVSVKCAFTLIS